MTPIKHTPNKSPIPLNLLDRKDLEHLITIGTTNLDDFKNRRDHHKRLEINGLGVSCYDCRVIAQKLGLEGL